MTRLASLFPLVTVVFVLPWGGLAGPACAKKYYKTTECISKCQAKWGYPGLMMGNDPWGGVMQSDGATETAWTAAISKACGMSSTTSVSPGESPASIAGAAETTSASYTISTLATTPAQAYSTSVTSSTTLQSVVSSSLSSPTTHSTTSTQKSTTHTTSSSTSSEARFTTSTTSKAHLTPQATETASHTTSSPESSATSGSSGSSSSGSSSGSNGSTSNSDIQAYLQGHNTIRAQHGAKALTWNQDLADAAQTWANKCVFKHSGGTLGPYGENLAAGTGDNYDIAAAITSWTNEVSEYDPSNPQPSHFTQVVWKASTQVGCAVQLCDGIFAASFGKAKFFVCEYSVQGNVIGEFAENVQA